MQKLGGRFIVLLFGTVLMAGCSSYNHQQAASDFIEGAVSNADHNRKTAEQQHRKADSSLLPDVIAGVGTVFLQWLTQSDDRSN